MYCITCECTKVCCVYILINLMVYGNKELNNKKSVCNN